MRQFKITCVGDVPHEGCGRCVGTLYASNLRAAKMIIDGWLMCVHIPYTREKDETTGAIIWKPCGDEDVNFSITLQETLMVV